jgi:hypothetical protein
MKDAGKRWGRDILLETGENWIYPAVYQAIRTPRYLYVKYDTGDEELYDVQRDPNELHSLHHDPKLADIKAELHRRLIELSSCAGAECRRGPKLALQLLYLVASRGEPPCSGNAITAGVVGRDRRSVERVDFLVDGRRIATDKRFPFVQRLPLKEPATRSAVRASIVMDDGRTLTLDRTLQVCLGRNGPRL